MSQDQQRDPAPRQRIRFEFVGALGDAPTEAAAGLARTARLLLAHADGHTGRDAVVRISLSGPRLDLSVRDPECSPACLERAVRLTELDASSVHLRVTGSSDRGLFLDWATGTPRSHARSVLRRLRLAG